MARVEAGTMPIPFCGCRVWVGYSYDGYARLSVDGSMTLAHRAVYEATRGPIPPGMVVNHLCEVKSCLNPDHLEVVSHTENVRYSYEPWWNNNTTKTHCKRGHELAGDNLYVHRGRRNCKTCKNASKRQRRAAQ
jgi:hypothetical protein